MHHWKLLVHAAEPVKTIDLFGARTSDVSSTCLLPKVDSEKYFKNAVIRLEGLILEQQSALVYIVFSAL